MVDQLYFRTGELRCGWEQVEMTKLHPTNECSGDGGASDQNIVNRRRDRFTRDPKTARRVSLRIAVNEEGSLLGGSEAGGEIDGCRRFPNTTFLVGDRDGSGHGTQGRGAGNIGAATRVGVTFHVARHRALLL